jgi:hypothetical protein
MYDVLLSPVMRETLHRQINDYSFNCKNYILQAVWSSTQAEQPQLSCGGPIEYGRYKNVAPVLKTVTGGCHGVKQIFLFDIGRRELSAIIHLIQHTALN